MFTGEISVACILTAATRLQKARGAASVHRDRNFELNINEHRRRGGLTTHGSTVCGRAVEARFGGAKREYFLHEHRFAIHGSPVIGLANFHWSGGAGKFRQQLPSSVVRRILRRRLPCRNSAWPSAWGLIFCMLPVSLC